LNPPIERRIYWPPETASPLARLYDREKAECGAPRDEFDDHEPDSIQPKLTA
jgi:hypothetical protein